MTNEQFLAIVDSNIAMFKTYTSEHAKSVLAELIAGRAAAVQSFEGKRAWQDVPYRVRQFRQEMPEWGTRGT
jgi:hypothetical protein